jgi:CRP/FNR family transcriptional regulator, nitrogen oxide reductase regulator
MRIKNVTAFPRITHNRFISCGRGFDVATSSPRQASSTHNPLLDMAAEARASACAVNCNGCITGCVRNSPLFAGLPPMAHRELSSKTIKQSFSERQPIFREDDPIRYLHIIGSGSVKITQVTKAGDEVILRVDRACAPIDEMCSTGENTHTTSAFALSGCCILTWYADEFADFAKRFPVIHSNATRIIQLRLRRLEKSFYDLSTAPVSQRLARVLLQLTGNNGVHTDSIGFSRQELAQMAGTSPFMISRLLSAWAERGIVLVNRSEVTIGDVTTLIRLSEGRPN